MIEKIEFSVEGQMDTITYNREEYLLHLIRKEKEHLGNQRVKSWINDGRIVVPKFVGGIPSYFWDCIVNIVDSKTLIICNPEDSIRFTIQVPQELIQWENYVEHFGNDKFFKSQEYKMVFERLNDYFEFQDKYYLKVLVKLTHKNNPFDAYSQMRYLDSDTGEFLPFTKEISRITPNPYSYDQKNVNLS